MASIRQVANMIEKSLEKWDYSRAINLSDNESKTRDFLIEPLLNILGYNKMDHYSHEFSVQFSKGYIKKVDMIVTINGKTPVMLIECKKANSNLTVKNFEQLSGYYKNHKDSKIGVLTNGIVYEFYSVKWNDDKVLNGTPFMTFNLENHTKSDIENLAQFHLQLFDVKGIMGNADEKYFLDDFDTALAKTLFPPSIEFRKIIYQNMGGYRMTEKISDRIYNLVNSISLQEAVDKVKHMEGESTKSGIVTTSTELKALQIIKTILAMSSKIKNEDLDRIGYKDYKGMFKVIIDEMPSKEVCQIVVNNKLNKLIVDNQDYLLESISAKELTKYKKPIVNEALKFLY